MEYDFVAIVKLHQDEILVNKDQFVQECLRREWLLFWPHEFVEVWWQNLYYFIGEGIQHFDLVGVTFNINIVVEWWWKEVHRDTTIKRS